MTELQLMRQSYLSAADICNKRVEHLLNPELESWTDSEFSVIGSAYHAGLEHMYKKPGSDDWAIDAIEYLCEAEQTIPSEIWDKFTWEDVGGSIDEAHSAVLVMLGIYAENHAWDLTKFEVVGTEYMFRNDEWKPGWFARGEIDLILVALEDTSVTYTQFVPNTGGGRAKWMRSKAVVLVNKGDHVIVDHKTARKPWDRGKEGVRRTNQPGWYTYWWRKELERLGEPIPKMIHFFFDVMPTNAKGFERRLGTATHPEIVAVGQKASSLASLIDKGGPFMPNTQSNLCHQRWCNFWNDCEFGSVLER